VRIEDMIFPLVCLYAPNYKNSRNIFKKKGNSYLKEYGNGIPILAGDFNDALKPVHRKTTRSSGLFADPVASLNTLIKSNKLLDIWGELNQNVNSPTLKNP
jgi:hypothetical protein